MAAGLIFSPKLQFFDANGNPLVGGKLYTYAAGTTTPLATYTDDTGTVLAANPIVLDSRGECSVWLSDDKYKFELRTAGDATVWTVDDVNAPAFVLTNSTGLPLDTGTAGILPISKGGTGFNTAQLAFTALKQNATTTDTGVVEIATNAEAQAGTSTTVVLTPANLLAANVVASTVTATTSGTSVTLTGTIPSTAKRVTVVLDQVSTSGTSPVLVQLGTSGPVWVTSGYSGTADNAYGTPTAYTAGVGVERTAAAAGSRSGILVLTKITANTWVASYTGTNGTDMCLGASRVALAAALTNVRLTTVGGTDTFDAGQANLFWE